MTCWSLSSELAVRRALANLLDWRGSVTAADLSHRYLWNPAAVDQLLADEQVSSPAATGEVLWALSDYLGSVRDVIESDGTLRIHKNFDSFGNVASETHYNSSGTVVTSGTGYVTEAFGFTGRYYDAATSLQNNLHRWYDASVGRWISEDPIGFAAGDANLYRYVGNMPTMDVDPNGLATYRLNRRIGGDQAKANCNVLSHTFILTTNPDGTLEHTYSWGNTANTHGWNRDEREDRRSANEVLRDPDRRLGLMVVGGDDLDPFIERAFDEFNVPENEHRWWLWNNCRHEASDISERALQLQHEERARRRQNTQR